MWWLLVVCRRAFGSESLAERAARVPPQGCVANWTRPAPKRPRNTRHWSAACGYEHRTLHSCKARAAYDCDESVWLATPPHRMVPATTIVAHYGGQLGNNMFQYAFGRRLKEAISNRSAARVSLVGKSNPKDATPRWSGMVDDSGSSSCRGSTAVVTDRDYYSSVPVCDQLRKALLEGHECVRVDGFFQDFAAIGGMEHHRELSAAFAPTTDECGDASTPDPDEVVVHVRTCTYVDAAPESWSGPYGPMPWLFYEIVIGEIYKKASNQGRRRPPLTVLSPPSCLSERGANLVRRLERDLGARPRAFSSIIGSKRDDGRADYCYLSRARRIVLQPSTFGWWAAWLSTATEIHFPLMGIFAHQRTLNYPRGPRSPSVKRGGPPLLKCDALFGGRGKSLVVPDERYVYHDIFSGHYFGRYNSVSNTFEDWGKHGGYAWKPDNESTAAFCADPPDRVFDSKRKYHRDRVGGRSMQLGCFANIEERLSAKNLLLDAGANAAKERRCCTESIRTSGLRISPEILLFPRSHVETALYYARTENRSIDFGFVGRVSAKIVDVTRARRWVLDFARVFFTNQSHYVDTAASGGNYTALGDWDKSRQYAFMINPNASHFVPMHYHHLEKSQHPCSMASCDPLYFSELARMKFALAPAGDMPYSQRFFEAVMAGAVPVVENQRHTGHSLGERRLGYKYFLASELAERITAFRSSSAGASAPLPYCANLASYNWDIFLQRQTVIKRRTSVNATAALCQLASFLPHTQS